MSRSESRQDATGYECWDCGNRVEHRAHNQLCPECGGYLRSTSHSQPDLR